MNEFKDTVDVLLPWEKVEKKLLHAFPGRVIGELNLKPNFKESVPYLGPEHRKILKRKRQVRGSVPSNEPRKNLRDAIE